MQLTVDEEIPYIGVLSCRVAKEWNCSIQQMDIYAKVESVNGNW